MPDVQATRPTDQHHSPDLSADVAIIGGGLAGLTLAAALGSAGVPVVVVDRDAPATHLSDRFDGRSTAIAFASAKALEGAGIWRYVMAEAQPILDIRVTDT